MQKSKNIFSSQNFKSLQIRLNSQCRRNFNRITNYQLVFSFCIFLNFLIKLKLSFFSTSSEYIFLKKLKWDDAKRQKWTMLITKFKLYLYIHNSHRHSEAKNRSGWWGDSKRDFASLTMYTLDYLRYFAEMRLLSKLM